MFESVKFTCGSEEEAVLKVVLTQAFISNANYAAGILRHLYTVQPPIIKFLIGPPIKMTRLEIKWLSVWESDFFSHFILFIYLFFNLQDPDTTTAPPLPFLIKHLPDIQFLLPLYK